MSKIAFDQIMIAKIITYQVLWHYFCSLSEIVSFSAYDLFLLASDVVIGLISVLLETGDAAIITACSLLGCALRRALANRCRNCFLADLFSAKVSVN